MRRTRTVIVGLAAALAGIGVASVGAAADGGPTPTGPNVGARPPAIIYRPAGLSTAQPVPLLIALYGTDGCPQCMEGLTHFEAVANQDGFVVAYPGSAMANNVPWTQRGDIPYISSLITQLEQDPTQNIDPKRVYVAGFSAGGRFAYQLGCALSKQITAIAVVGSVQRPYVCRLSHPVSELTIMGSTEAIGGIPSRGIPSSATVEGWWRTRDGCPRAAVTTTSSPIVVRYSGGCVDASRVGLYIVMGGHHTWPGCTCNLAANDPDRLWNASQGIWAFFSGIKTGSLTTPQASLLSLRASSRHGQRWVLASFALGEQVSVKETISSSNNKPAGSTVAPLHAGRRVSVSLKVAKKARAGLARLAITVTDQYGRKLTLTRRVRLP